MTRITGAVRRDDTIQRLGGNGDNWYPTWGADGSLYVALCDGTGFAGMPRNNYNSRLIRIEGTPETGLTFHDVPGYPMLGYPMRGEYDTTAPGTRLGIRYYGFGTLSVDGTIYQYLNTWPVPLTEEVVAGNGELKFVGAKLIYSPDGGTTWHNQDGSTPVVWEDFGEQSLDNQVFFHEPGESFSLQGILQMGQDYSLNEDGFVYVYSPNGNDEGTMNQLVLFRVPKNKIRERSAYRYFAGYKGGEAAWSSNINDRKPIHTFPSGWVNTDIHPYAWQANVTYNPALGLYLMGNWATGPSPEGMWFGKPSYMSFLQSKTPWGPWETFYEDDHWTPGGDENARAYQPIIVPNWISDDGKSFWMIWTDFQQIAEKGEAGKAANEANPDNSDDEYAENLRAGMPYYSFNIQKVELTVE
jgi:hypothetical protein